MESTARLGQAKNPDSRRREEKNLDPVTRQWSETAAGSPAQPGWRESWEAGGRTDQLAPAGREHTGVDVETLRDMVSGRPENHAGDTVMSQGRPALLRLPPRNMGRSLHGALSASLP